MSRKNKTEARKARKLKEIDKRKQLSKKELDQTQGGYLSGDGENQYGQLYQYSSNKK